MCALPIEWEDGLELCTVKMYCKVVSIIKANKDAGGYSMGFDWNFERELSPSRLNLRSDINKEQG